MSNNPERRAEANAVRVLQVEDNVVDAELVQRYLRKDGPPFVCRIVDDELSFRRAIQDFGPNVVLSDFSLPGFDGLSALSIATEMIPDVPFIFVSGTIGEERAIEAMKRGAADYVLKDNLKRLVPAINNALKRAEATRARATAEALLRRSESRLQDIINTSRDWIWECDAEGRFRFSSPSVEAILGYTSHEVLGRRAADYIDRGDELQMLATFAEVRSDDELAKPVTLRWRTKSGKVCWLERSMVALRGSGGELRGVRGIDRDVTLRTAQEVRIRRLNRALRFVSGASAAAVRIADREELLKEACRLAVAVAGYLRATISLLPLGGTQPLVGTYDGGANRAARWTTTDRLPATGNAAARAVETGEPFIVEDVASAAARGLEISDLDALLAQGARSSIALPLMMDGTAIGALELYGDESRIFGDAELALLKQVAANVAFSLRYLQKVESVEYLEYFDRLTSLANRSLFVQRLGSALTQVGRDGAGRVALLVFDICDLGMINDGLGHHAGDLLLQLVAERLKDLYRDSNVLARIVGDRFAVFGVGDSPDLGDELKEQIACLFDEPFEILEQQIRVAARAGFVIASDDMRDGAELLGQAQTALDHAKAANEQFLRHRPNMNETASRRLSLINELRHAVAGREFTLAYQPKVEIASGIVSGVEALLRWPRRADPVTPDVFVPMLESLGLIDDVGAWVLELALAETAAWAAAGTSFRVAVNLSPLQLNREDFADRVLALLAADGARRLELEVTESTVMADPRRASASLALLRDAGVTIAIDDFGTGHSSLRVLAGLPVDVVKIDRSFVHDLATNRSHRLIVQATITMAAAMGLKTVAEGVETEEHAAILRDLGCTAIQGYLYHRPVPASELESWIAPRLGALA